MRVKSHQFEKLLDKRKTKLYEMYVRCQSDDDTTRKTRGLIIIRRN